MSYVIRHSIYILFFTNSSYSFLFSVNVRDMIDWSTFTIRATSDSLKPLASLSKIISFRSSNIYCFDFSIRAIFLLSPVIHTY